MPGFGKIIIAIDGHSACGKSTLARDLAASLGYAYIDTGAMYRAVTLFFLQNQINYDDPEAVEKALDHIEVRFSCVDGQNHTFLNGDDVEDEIRKLYVSQQVSQVAAISAVRRAMVAQQQRMGEERGIVMDGRDIGTVVFPDAKLKLFVTADQSTRINRRLLELEQRGLKISREEVAANLQQRDHIDSTREDSPLRQAEDAILLDNTALSKEQQLEKALALAHTVISASS
jgi:cytidylate kinase